MCGVGVTTASFIELKWIHAPTQRTSTSFLAFILRCLLFPPLESSVGPNREQEISTDPFPLCYLKVSCHKGWEATWSPNSFEVKLEREENEQSKAKGQPGKLSCCCKPRRVEALKRDGDILHFGARWIDSVCPSQWGMNVEPGRRFVDSCSEGQDTQSGHQASPSVNSAERTHPKISTAWLLSGDTLKFPSLCCPAGWRDFKVPPSISPAKWRDPKVPHSAASDRRRDPLDSSHLMLLLSGVLGCRFYTMRRCDKMYQTCCLSTWEAEARRSQLQKQPELQSQTLSPKQSATVTERHIIHRGKTPVLIEIRTKGRRELLQLLGKSVWRFLKPKQQQKTKSKHQHRQ